MTIFVNCRWCLSFKRFTESKLSTRESLAKALHLLYLDSELQILKRARRRAGMPRNAR